MPLQWWRALCLLRCWLDCLGVLDKCGLPPGHGGVIDSLVLGVRRVSKHRYRRNLPVHSQETPAAQLPDSHCRQGEPGEDRRPCSLESPVQHFHHAGDQEDDPDELRVEHGQHCSVVSRVQQVAHPGDVEQRLQWHLAPGDEGLAPAYPLRHWCLNRHDLSWGTSSNNLSYNLGDSKLPKKKSPATLGKRDFCMEAVVIPH
ncbi:hypothetical protein FB451DRAFT_1180307 [Mycena latifolia]|nr:hypothetical protein FB451DRAFT_1180307 [Mycena latifolia]